jgi:hypothetical protein
MTDIFKLISAWSIVIPILFGLLYLRWFDANSRIMFALILLAGVPQLASAIYDDPKYDYYTMMLYNCYALADPLIWAILFFRNIKNKKLRNAVAILPIAQIILWFNLLVTKDIHTEFFIELICLTSVVQVLWTAVFFYEQYKSYEVSRIEKKPLFWFCLAIMIYAPTTYFLFVFYNQLHGKNPANNNLWNIHSIINPLMYCIISIGFWVNKRNENTVS